MKDWDPEHDLAALTQEVDVTGKSEDAIAADIIRDAAPIAARSIVHIAMYSLDERKRLEAAKYIIDRRLGRVGEEKKDHEGEKTPLEDLLGDGVITEIEVFANNGEVD